ncbi:MAG: 3-hydroxyacyl-ACP dehydratase FabZ family protein [Candidatus Binatia bacterium]
MRFILIDRILKMEEGKEGLFLKNVSQSEDYFADHFPGSPIMPGSLILEGFEQGSQLLIAFTHNFAFYPEIHHISRATFKHYVLPGDQLQIFLSLAQGDGKEVRVKAKARANDRVMAEATLGFTLIDRKSDAEAAERCCRLEALYHLLSTDPIARAWESLSRHQTSK